MAEAICQEAALRDTPIDRALNPAHAEIPSSRGRPPRPPRTRIVGSVLGRAARYRGNGAARLAKLSAVESTFQFRVPVTDRSRSHCQARWDDTDDTKLSHDDIWPIHQLANMAALEDPPDAH